MKFTTNDYKAMQVDARNCAGATLTISEIKEIIKTNRNGLSAVIWNDFQSVGHPSPKYGMDTAIRDVWLDMIANHLVGENWPSGMDGEKVGSKFFDKFARALKKIS